MAPMRIMLTGAAGKLGREVLRDLLAHDHEVLAVDRVPMPPGCGCGSTVVDLTDLGQTLDTVLGNDDRLGGFDAIVHLAAVPAGGIAPAREGGGGGAGPLIGRLIHGMPGVPFHPFELDGPPH